MQRITWQHLRAAYSDAIKARSNLRYAVRRGIETTEAFYSAAVAGALFTDFCKRYLAQRKVTTTE